MASFIPITLAGNNLGIRHKQINTLVKDAFDSKADLKSIKREPENSAIDRIFKIELASKHRDVDYIIANLKDSDLLYVSKALKSKWLLETKYQDIINPDHLENDLYPFMITTAVTKMKHWIHLNMKNTDRSEEFYKYYCEKEFDVAVKFLYKCSKEFILNQFPKILNIILPRHFKLLCETCPEVAKLFYESLHADEKQKARYLSQQKMFFNSMKCLLKSDTNLYLDITERYFDVNSFDRFSSIATKFIMTQYKERFLKKPELYTAWILNIPTLAETLTVEEAKVLVEKLARASFLASWFNYKNVEPLIRRLKPEERAAFKKKVFVQYDVGDKVEEWPYDPPSAPQTEYLEADIFVDQRHDPSEYLRLGKQLTKRKYRMKCGNKFEDCEIVNCEKVKTLLDKLFDEYRYVGFERTFYELRKRILAESTPQNRQFIMMVLISKTGGRADAISALMELLARHSNEPANLRSAVIRSLVKRAFIWRLPEETWNQLLQFAQGLGLDGSPPEADCFEGLHSVVIRSLLQTGTCVSVIFDAFLNNFSDLTEYSLTPAEKISIGETLPKLLLSAVKDKTDINDALNITNKLIDVLTAYKLKADIYPGLLPTIIELAEKKYEACVYLLTDLFRKKIGRKELFLFNSKLIRTDHSFVNALKHDIDVLNFDNFGEFYLDYEHFFRKVSIYFSEDGGLSMKYKNKLKEKDHDKYTGRPLAILLTGIELESYLQELDKAEIVETKVFAAVIRSNAHMSRPNLDIDNFGWQKAGAKMISNKLVTCPSVDVDKNIQKLLRWKRTARLALILAKRTKGETTAFLSLVKLRPTIGIKLGIKKIRQQGDSFDIKYWEAIKPFIEKFDFNNNNKQHIRKLLSEVNSIPMKIRLEYSIIIFNGYDKIESEKRYKAMPYLCHIENLLPNTNEEFFENLLSDYLENDLVPDKFSKKYDDIVCTCMFLRIIVKYILFSESQEVQSYRFERFGKQMFMRLEAILNDPIMQETFYKFLDEVLLNFKNTTIFMDCKYVSCLPVMEKTIIWMQKILPIDEYFDNYVPVHLTMLYFKAIRQTVKQVPKVFENEKIRISDGVKIVGNLFGKYIARELNELIAKYFESIIYLYADGIVFFLDNYFNNTQSANFLASIINGILEESKGDEVRLAMYMLKEKYYSVGEEVSAEISERFKELKDLKSQYFVFGNLYA